jgi:hypothetical protein
VVAATAEIAGASVARGRRRVRRTAMRTSAQGSLARTLERRWPLHPPS